MDFLQTLDVRAQINDFIRNQGIKMTVISKKIGCSAPHLTLVLKGERPLTDENLKRLNEQLGTDFKRSESPTAVSTPQHPMKATG